MLSILHEFVLDLLRAQPELLQSLLHDAGHPDLPATAPVHLAPADLNVLAPVEFRADMTLLFGEPKTPFFAAVVEVQLREDADKLLTWPVYAALLRAKLGCPTVVAVFTTDANVARWASRPIDLGGGNTFTPTVFGPGTVPRIADVDQARRWPALALLSALVYGMQPDGQELVEPIKAALKQLDKSQDMIYIEALGRALNDGARKLLEKIMKLPEDFEFTFPPLRRAFDAGKARGEKERDESVRRGKEQGEALGKARAVVRLLERRRILVPDASRERILGCADLELLSCWFDRAVEASSVEEVLEG